jgi:hypothetical protein
MFENCILKPFLGPHDILLPSTRMISTILAGDMPRIIPVKFGQNWTCNMGGDVV